jgi:hypothetical protein
MKVTIGETTLVFTYTDTGRVMGMFHAQEGEVLLDVHPCYVDPADGETYYPTLDLQDIRVLKQWLDVTFPEA